MRCVLSEKTLVKKSVEIKWRNSDSIKFVTLEKIIAFFLKGATERK